MIWCQRVLRKRLWADSSQGPQGWVPMLSGDFYGGIGAPWQWISVSQSEPLEAFPQAGLEGTFEALLGLKD